jgi:hypothetical protein
VAASVLAAILGPLLSLAELATFSYRHRRRSSGSWLRFCLAELKAAMRSREISSPAATVAPPSPGAGVSQQPAEKAASFKEEETEDSVRERLLFRKVEEDRFENSRL